MDPSETRIVGRLFSTKWESRLESDLTGLVFMEDCMENLCLADGIVAGNVYFPEARRRYEILNAMIDSVIG